MDTSRPKGALFLHQIAVLFLGAYCGLLVACKNPQLQPLRVRVSGCSLLWDRASHLVCASEPDDKLRLILSIEGPPLARLRFQISDTADGHTELSSSGHGTVNAPFPKAASRVTLHAESAEGEVEYTLDVQPKMPFARAYARHDALDCGHAARRCLESAQKLLADLDASPREFDATEQAFLLGLIGKRLVGVLKVAAQADEAQALRQLTLSVLERAMAEARTTGLLSVEAWALDRLGKALVDQGAAYDPQLAVAKLSNPVHERALAQLPDALAHVQYQMSRIAADRGDLAASRNYAREAAVLSEEFVQVRAFQVVTRLQEALAAQSLQETQEAERLTRWVEEKLRTGFLEDPCDLAEQYNQLAWIKLVARQSGHAGADPEVFFEQAAASLLRCEKPSKVGEQSAVLSTNRALYAMLCAEQAPRGSGERRHQLDLAKALGRQAQEAQAKARRATQADIETDLADLGARIALLRGQGQDALHAFAQLEQLTATERLSPYYRWASQIGQADAHLLLGQTQDALTRYARAEALLDRMAAELPMTTRRQLFLAQFEAGTGRYLKLLLAVPGAQDEVLAVIRHARIRALRTYARAPFASGGQRRTDQLLAQYSTLLGQREETKAELDASPSAEQNRVRNRLQSLEREMTEVLKELYTGGSATSAQPMLRSPADGELLIACFPLPAEPGEPPPLWICAGATASGTQVLRIAAPIEAAPEQAAQAILTGFGAALRQAKHLQILPYGLLRAVPWASLRWEGRRLEERLTISYGVDPPCLARLRPPAGKRALLVTNPQQDLPGAERTGDRLRKELPATGWQMDARTGAPYRGGHLLALVRTPLRRWQLPPAVTKDVVAQLSSVELFVYYGHAESSGPGGWDSHLLFADDGSISAYDIMSLPTVPRKVLLIGCETAVSDREAPADEAGLAQAFVLRGSEAVLATTRKVSDMTAAALVDKLTQLGALRPDGPPLAAAVRDAIAALRPRYPADDLNAFRVYTP